MALMAILGGIVVAIIAWIAVNGWWGFEGLAVVVAVVVSAVVVYLRRRRWAARGLPRRTRIRTGASAGLVAVLVVLVLIWSTPPWWGYVLGGVIVAVAIFARALWVWRRRTNVEPSQPVS